MFFQIDQAELARQRLPFRQNFPISRNMSRRSPLARIEVASPAC